MDGIALASVVVSGLLGGAGLWAGLATARDGRNHVERMAGEQRDHELEMAQEARQAGWRVELCQDLYAILGRYAVVDNPATADIVDPPSWEELLGVVTRAQVFGSEEVSRLTLRWLELYSAPEGETEEARDKRVQDSRETTLAIRSAIRRDLHVAAETLEWASGP